MLTDEPTTPDNAVLAVSMACCRAAAKHKDLEVYEFIADLAGVSDPCIPVPVFSVINGANSASSPLHLQVSRRARTVASARARGKPSE